MKHILLLTHGTFAEGIKASAELITGACDFVTTMCIGADDAPQTVSTQIREYLDMLPETDVKIIITDIPGGSTTQGALPFTSDEKNVYVITGLNLGLLLELILGCNSDDLDADLHRALKNAQDTIQLLNDLLKREAI